MSSNITEPPIKLNELCNFCKHIDKDRMRCKKRRKGVADLEIVDHCHFYDNSLYQRFMEFYKNEWQEDQAYFTTDFTDRFGISRHLARHYLYEIMVLKEKVLFRIKEYNKATYFKRTPEMLEKMEAVMHKGAILEK